MGTGAEVVSGPGTLTAPSAPGALPTVSGGATFNQSGMVTFNQLGQVVAGSGSLNDAGALTLGLNGGVGVYNFSGGVLNAASEAVGGDSASFGVFNQTAGLNTVKGALTVGAGSYFALSGAYYVQSNSSELSAGSVQVNGSFNQSGGSAAVGALTVASGGSYTLSGGELRGQTETVVGSFTQSGGSNGGGGAGSLLTIENGGVYDLAGGSLSINTTIGAGGQLAFDGGVVGNASFTAAQSITLNSGGSVTSNGNELIDSSAIFTQTGGINTTTKLTIVTPDSGAPYGVYDLQGGTLKAGTIAVNAENRNGVSGSGYFYFDGGTANYTTFNLKGGTVASGTAGSLASASASDMGTGAEVVSGPGTLTAPSAPGALPTVSGGVTFNQSGGSNYAGALTLGFNGGIGVYNLSGAGALKAATESIGGGDISGSLLNQTGGGLFDQTGGDNKVSGEVTVNGPSNGKGGGFYELQSGMLSADSLQINPGGVFDQTGGQATISGQATNLGAVTIGGGATLAVGELYKNIGLTLLQGGKLQAGGILNAAGLIGGTGTLEGSVTVLSGIVQIGASPDALHVEGPYSQTGGIIKFEVDPNGQGGYLESSIVFDPGSGVSISGTQIVFDFLNGANPLTFFDSGAFNLDAFFQDSDGSLFSNNFNLRSLFAGDTFATNLLGFEITGFGANGAVRLTESAAVRESSTWALMALGFAALGFVGYRNVQKKGAVAA
jgi:hypothetical protein